LEDAGSGLYDFHRAKPQEVGGLRFFLPQMDLIEIRANRIY
jgi:hypothetical protein